MRPELEQSSQIEAFLEGSMDQEGARKFQVALEANPTLQVEVQVQKALTDRIRHNALLRSIQSVHEELENGGGEPRQLLPRLGGRFRFFSTLIVALGIGIGSLLIGKCGKGNKKTKVKKKIAQVNPQPLGIVVDSFPKLNAESLIADSNVSKSKIILPLPARQNDLPAAFQVPFRSYTFQAENGAIFKDPRSESIINIPANALLDQTGNTVKGKVELKYREFRNAADIAFSGIPMTYQGSDGPYNFNSAGMFEILALKDGIKLMLNQKTPILIDFELTQAIPDLDFYVLNPNRSKWKKLNEIKLPVTGLLDIVSEDSPVIVKDDLVAESFPKPGSINAEIKSANVAEVSEKQMADLPKATIDALCNRIVYPAIAKEAEITGRVWIRAKVNEKGEIVKANAVYASHSILANGCVSSLQGATGLPISKVSGQPVSYWLKIPFEFEEGKVKMPDVVDSIDTTQVFTPPSQPVDPQSGNPIPRNRFPKLIRGLRVEGFGVYNCDQIVRITDPILISPEFVDKDGQPIPDAKVVSVVDLRLNAAFSFSPNSFSLQRSGKNVLLLFTKSGTLYGINEKRFAKLRVEKAGKHRFVMKNITRKVRGRDDLKKYLRLKR